MSIATLLDNLRGMESLTATTAADEIDRLITELDAAKSERRGLLGLVRAELDGEERSPMRLLDLAKQRKAERDAAIEERNAARDAALQRAERLQRAICPDWKARGLSADALVPLAEAHRSDSETMDAVGDRFDVSYRDALQRAEQAEAALAVEKECYVAGMVDYQQRRMELEAALAQARGALQWPDGAWSVSSCTEPPTPEETRLCIDAWRAALAAEQVAHEREKRERERDWDGKKKAQAERNVNLPCGECGYGHSAAIDAEPDAMAERARMKAARVAQPPAMPPLPETWICEQTTWGPFYRTHDTYVGFDGRTPPQGQVSVRADGPRVSATHVPLADLIIVLRHAEAAHLKLKGATPR